ncbi:hypothetical protein [Shewanella kaireitica]|uniref:hypothetical protein n=1 Tax=Shewanella kaireitica TaxID=212021 RepID=UPI00200EEBDF|nr:hypothetical protein [Shewanella kaireitica]MCL1093184.1 hypothetical protein [Shewanella kaireitica]
MRYTVMFLSLLLIGCESSQDMFKNQNEEGQIVDSGIRCEMMARTGSNRKMKVCRTVEQIKKDEKEAYSSLNRKQRTGYTIPREGGLPN